MRTRHGTSFDHLMSFLILSSLTYSINIYVHDAYQEVAGIAQWEDEQIEYIKEKVTEEGRQEDLKKGKAPAQVYLHGILTCLIFCSVNFFLFVSCALGIRENEHVRLQFNYERPCSFQFLCVDRVG